MLEGYRCEMCGLEWLARSTFEEMPTVCPKCKSHSWNTKRKSAVTLIKVKEPKVRAPKVRA